MKTIMADKKDMINIQNSLRRKHIKILFHFWRSLKIIKNSAENRKIDFLSLEALGHENTKDYFPKGFKLKTLQADFYF